MYATRANFESAFGAAETADLDVPAGRVLAAIDQAGAEADGYLATRYTVPVASVGANLTRITLDIARFRLWDNRSPEEVRTRYEDAVKWLRDVSAGKVLLTDASGLPIATPSTSSSAIAASSRTLSYQDGFERANAYQPSRWFDYP